MKTNYLSWDQMFLEWYLLPQVVQAAFHLWGLPEVDLLASSHSTQCQHYYTLESSLPLGAFGLNAFNHPWTFQEGYMFSPPMLVPLVLSKFLAEHVESQLRQFILVAPCWMEAPWLPTVHNMLADIPWWCPIITGLIVDISVGQVLKDLPYLHLTLWLLSNVCYADRGSLPQSVRQWQGQLEHLHQRSTRSVGRNGQVGVLNRVCQTMPSLPLNYLLFWYIYFMLAWPGIPLVYIILLFLHFWSLIVFTRLLIILSLQNSCILFIYSDLLINVLILGMLSVCYLCWRVGHLFLLSLPLSLPRSVCYLCWRVGHLFLLSLPLSLPGRLLLF